MGKTDFQDDSHGDYLEFLIGMILAILDLQVATIFPTKFRVSWPFCSGDDGQNRFSRWQPRWNSGRNKFRYFLSSRYPDTFYHVSR